MCSISGLSKDLDFKIDNILYYHVSTDKNI